MIGHTFVIYMCSRFIAHSLKDVFASATAGKKRGGIPISSDEASDEINFIVEAVEIEKNQWVIRC